MNSTNTSAFEGKSVQEIIDEITTTQKKLAVKRQKNIDNLNAELQKLESWQLVEIQQIIRNILKSRPPLISYLGSGLSNLVW